MTTRLGCVVALFSLLVISCASSVDTDDVAPSTTVRTSTTVEPADTEPVSSSDFPDITDAVATQGTDGTWRFDVTVSSPYDSPERYADAWRVVGPDGAEYGIRELTHDHASEQPFTRSQSGIVIPDAVRIVTIEGRDLINGWGGGTLDVELP